MAFPNEKKTESDKTCKCKWWDYNTEKIWREVVAIPKKLKKLGKDDPRRIIHSVKLGLALTVVSFFYYFHPLYEGFGVAAMWAILTVVVVFEFTVGATLGRGSNRMLATLVAGTLGVGAHHLAILSGVVGEPILIAAFNFLLAGTITFLRFLPGMKANYDYGLLIFILTFCLVSVSGYRDDKVIHMAMRRVLTIIIGSSVAIVICIFIFPVWIGSDLHDLIAFNLDQLGVFLEGFADEYFKEFDQNGKSINKSFLEGYKSVLTSKSTEETMANLARWEPCHGRFKFRHPWKQYLKVGTLTRHCAYKIDALHSFLDSDIQTPLRIRSKIEEPCKIISSECGKSVQEFASAIKTMTCSSEVGELHISNSKFAAEELKSKLKYSSLWKDFDVLEITPIVAMASLLLEVISCIEKISEAFHELTTLAKFKVGKPPDHQVTQKEPQSLPREVDGSHQILSVGE